MGEPQKRYVRRKKLDTKVYIVWFHLHETSRIGKCAETADYEGK